MKILGGELKYVALEDGNIIVLGDNNLVGATVDPANTEGQKNTIIGENNGQNSQFDGCIILGDGNLNDATVGGSWAGIQWHSSNLIAIGEGNFDKNEDVVNNYTRYSIAIGYNNLKNVASSAGFGKITRQNDIAIGNDANYQPNDGSYGFTDDDYSIRNVFIGDAPARNGAFQYSVAMGHQALYQCYRKPSDATHKYVTAVGFKSGWAAGQVYNGSTTETIEDSSFFGYESGSYANGLNNFIAGSLAGHRINGDRNLILAARGYLPDERLSPSIMDDCILIGAGAERSTVNSSISGVIAIGNGSNKGNTGDNCVFIGEDAGTGNETDNLFQVGNQTTTSSSSITVAVYGDAGYLLFSNTAEEDAVEAIVDGVQAGNIVLTSFVTDAPQTFTGSGTGFGGYNERFKSGSDNLRLNNDEGAMRFIGTIGGVTAGDTGIASITINYNKTVSDPIITGDMANKKMSLHSDTAGDIALTIAGNDAVQVPVGTTGERPASPADGMIRLNSTTGKFEGYVSGAWVDFH